jgi:hypothetical protein
MTKTPDRGAIIEGWRIVRWARDAEMFHRKRGQYEQAVAFQQIADAVERRDSVLDCEFIYHEAVHAKVIRNREGSLL